MTPLKYDGITEMKAMLDIINSAFYIGNLSRIGDSFWLER